MTTSPQDKIKTIDEVSRLTEKMRREGLKTVLCHGVFDVLHPGHVRHLQQAKKEGDILIVSVTPDRYANRGPGRPIFPVQLRAEVLASLACVQYVVINEWATAVNTIEKIKPSVYVKGSDYADRSKDVTGGIYEEEEALKKVDGRLVFTNEITFSSSALINNLFSVYSKETNDFLIEFRKRVKEDEIIANVNRLAGCKVLVLGDAIIDEYHYCSPMGKSPKENIIVTKYSSEERFAGGALAAANHVANFCDSLDLITCLGNQNSYEGFVKKALKPNVNATLFCEKNVPTIVKRRFVEPNYVRKLFEICFMDGNYLSPEMENEILKKLEEKIDQYDLVLVTDFGHGFVTPKIIDLVSRKAKFLAVNAQSNSANLGYNLITKYPRADYICIDEPEARLALHDKINPIESIMTRLSEQLRASFVMITRGNHGCVAFSREKGFFKIPALTSNVLDTVGAGDAFLSVSSPCIAMGLPIEQAAFIGNAAGALKVGIVGNRSSVEKAPLLKFLTTLLK